MEKTTDYNLFKRMDGNRPLKVAHIQELVDAIQKKNLLNARPILVNEHYEIIDGQHRLEAARILGVPIFYEKIDGLNISDVAIVNSNQRNWKLDYFLSLYCNQMKNENYINLNNWLIENDFTLNQGISFFIDEHNVGSFKESFKTGGFIFINSIHKSSERYKTFINKLSPTLGSRNVFKQQGFIRAFIMFFSNPEIDERRFWEQMDKYPFIVTARPTKQLLLEMLYEIYNYRKHVKVEN